MRNSKISVFWPCFSSSQEARLAEAKAAKAAKEAKEAKEKRAREAAEQLRRDKATDATSSERSHPSSSSKRKQPSSWGKGKGKRRRFFFEWIEASNMTENDWYDGHSRCTDSIRFAQAQVRLGVLWRWWGYSKGLRDAWPQKWLESGISSVSECRVLPWIVIEVIVCTMVLLP